MMLEITDIQRGCTHDGPGLRTTVFLKGCPLSCIWCHNPEGLNPYPELSVKSTGCLGCKKCYQPCAHEECKPFGRCLHTCPRDLVSVVGRYIEADELAKKILRGRDIFEETGGGVTVSGGEPLLQHEFLLELIAYLDVHTLLETSGYAPHEVFKRTVSAFDTVYMDLKLADREAHKEYTGVYNDIILENLYFLQNSGIDHKIRVPLIPDITDTEENLRAIARLAKDSEVELLPYNSLAGAKYQSVGRTFTDRITKTQNNSIDPSIFKNAHIK